MFAGNSGIDHMAKIFISYRREDSQHAVDRLQDVMKPYLKNPKRDLFVDVDNIPIGVDFEAHLQTKISQCDAVLAVMGPGWLTARAPNGQPRLERPDDFVRTEIAAALQRGIPVVPVLLDGTSMPRADQLPADIRDLTKRNGAQLDRKSFRADVDHIMSGLGFGQRKSALPKVLIGLTTAIIVIAGGAWAVQEWGSRPATERADAFDEIATTESSGRLFSENPESSSSNARADAEVRQSLIRRLQYAFIEMEYANFEVDGILGPATQSAAMMVGLDYNISTPDLASLEIGELLQYVLKVEKFAGSDSFGTASVDPQTPDRKTLIERYQRALTTLGYYHGPINGQPDDATHSATKYFSKDADLTNLGLDFANLDAIERQVVLAESLASNIDESLSD